jgi:hypothetical protein
MKTRRKQLLAYYVVLNTCGMDDLEDERFCCCCCCCFNSLNVSLSFLFFAQSSNVFKGLSGLGGTTGFNVVVVVVVEAPLGGTTGFNVVGIVVVSETPMGGTTGFNADIVVVGVEAPLDGTIGFSVGIAGVVVETPLDGMVGFGAIVVVVVIFVVVKTPEGALRPYVIKKINLCFSVIQE